MSRRVVITGMGAITPLGTGVEKFWAGIKANKLGISFIDMFDTDRTGVKIAGIVRDFNEEDYYGVEGCFEKKEARHMDRFTKYAVVAAHEALTDAGTDLRDLDPYRVGVLVGSGIGGIDLTLSEYEKYLEKGPGRMSAFYIPMMISNMAAGTISMKTGFRGANFDITTACATGTHSIGEAFRKIKDGYLDACLAGGTESTGVEFTYGGFANMKALTKSGDLERASIPFDKERSGFVLGEGSAVIVLEEYEHAKARGAKIYAEVAGYGATCDGYHMTSPMPGGEAAAKGMELAMEEAGLRPEDIDYINAHGTSTGLNDKYETAAIKLALGDYAKKVKISSTKSMTGHLLGAAGAVEAVVCAKSIQEGFIHATVGYKVPDEECDLDYCGNGNIEQEVNAVLSNSLGFGGHNATLCFRRVKD
ncbi:MAG: beta-ketoacyl-ACP synthase II [Ruminococcus sp.]|uniref:beta-ketoacyl-ACP synthase II n=1 Tax=Ruminococcus flavefaciens TaxID=1265 RepID=UPI0026EFB391|nr:beta-ketoacyl-ACP synthase II [Ruminococcus flavefaciens]MBR0511416.1 beta-ketoacyl-ACP synthase II [Ruminococcus sp.]